MLKGFRQGIKAAFVPNEHFAYYVPHARRLFILRRNGTKRIDYGTMTRFEARNVAKWYGATVLVVFKDAFPDSDSL